MRKINVTRKYVRDNFTNIICVPYCGLQDLLKYQTPSWFTSGIYGWNADVFNRTAQKADTPEKCKDLLNAYIKEVLSNV